MFLLHPNIRVWCELNPLFGPGWYPSIGSGHKYKGIFLRWNEKNRTTEGGLFTVAMLKPEDEDTQETTAAIACIVYCKGEWFVPGKTIPCLLCVKNITVFMQIWLLSVTIRFCSVNFVSEAWSMRHNSHLPKKFFSWVGNSERRPTLMTPQSYLG